MIEAIYLKNANLFLEKPNIVSWDLTSAQRSSGTQQQVSTARPQAVFRRTGGSFQMWNPCSDPELNSSFLDHDFKFLEVKRIEC